ncbi:hypothetical protein [Streptomyces sp. NPDC005303]|uniref:hypothetical protein n=1 Tax=Streptomyces sp. NPDC005303 TaxID=3155713 RepID=UPI0033A9C78B
MSLAVARRQLAARQPSMSSLVVRSPGGFEAACYDQRGHLVFWRYSAGGWHQMAQSTYPPDSADGPPSYDEHGVGVEGAVLPGMSDAVFIVTGPFSGDGTGNAVAFGNGPDGWGLLVQDGASRLRSSGTGSSSSDTGQYLSARFTGGLMETAVNSGAFSNAFGSGFPVRRQWRWSKDHLVLASDSVVTAATTSAPTGDVPVLPSAAPTDGTYGALLQYATVSDAHTTLGKDAHIDLAVAPARVSTACASKGMCAADATSATAHVTAGAQVRTAYPVVAEGRQKLITGPLWPLAGIAQSLWGEDSNTSFQPLETSPGGYRTRGATPWYIPATLHATEFRVGQGAPVEITFRNRSVTGVVLMAAAE